MFNSLSTLPLSKVSLSTLSLADLEQLKEQLNQAILNLLPTSWQEMALQIIHRVGRMILA